MDRTKELITLLDMAEGRTWARELRERSYELLGVAPGTAVVDVGCGAGRAVAEMAEQGARAVGLDPDEQMISVARERYADGDFRLADAYELPFPDGSLDGHRAEKVYHVLDDPARALAEARRVLAPGGRIVLLGQDWDTIVIDSDDPALTRAVVHARADLVPSPRVVRRTRNLLLDAGFSGVEQEIRTTIFTDASMLPMLTDLAARAREAGTISDAQAEGWITEQRRRGDRGRLFLALPIFVTAATRE